MGGGRGGGVSSSGEILMPLLLAVKCHDGRKKNAAIWIVPPPSFAFKKGNVPCACVSVCGPHGIVGWAAALKPTHIQDASGRGLTF